MGDRRCQIQLHSLVSKQSDGPALVSFGDLGAGQGHKLCFKSSIKFDFTGWFLPDLAFQCSLKAFLNKSFFQVFHRARINLVAWLFLFLVMFSSSSRSCSVKTIRYLGDMAASLLVAVAAFLSHYYKNEKQNVTWY